MAENKVHRLSKVAKELNVSTSTIIDFLKGKNIAIDNNPNAKITDDIYGILSSEFHSEKAILEEARQVSSTINKVKKESISAEDSNTRKPDRRQVEEQEDIVIKNHHSPFGEKKEPEVIKAKVEKDIGVKVVDKIDLGAKNLKTKPDKKTQKEKDEAVAAETEAKKKTAKEKEEKIEEPPVVEKVEEKKTEEKKEDFFATKIEKLEGPTIIGKINLPVEERKKPVASSSADFQKDKKKKRRRIKKEGGGFADQNTTEGGAPRTGGAPSTGGGGGRFDRNKRGPAKTAPTQDEIQAQIKETLARLSGSGNKSKASKYRKLKREMVSERIQEETAQQEAEKKVLKVTEFVSANQLSQMMAVPVTDIISTCMSLGLFVSINQRLDAETISIVAEEFGFTVEFVSVEVQESIKEEEDTPEELVPRPPIVTVMGHVDHGKTSLLDYIRKSNVIAGEAGGITQHIGAYNVKLENGKAITFLDTPGHEAFTAMRARGAKVTDVAIIVVAADDSVMPQTVEAINHVQAAGVPMVFAINKIDKPGANADKIREALSQMNILVEEWGGKYQCQEISAKKGLNIDHLLEKVLLEAEMRDMKANPNKRAVGTVIESELDKGKGYVTTVLVEAGTLKVGDILLAGCYSGRVKAMNNERGQKVDGAGPSMPVSILGLSGAPQAGDKFHIMSDEREAREIANKRLQLQREQSVRTQKHITLDEIGRRLAIGNFKELNIVVKGDVDGSVEALSDSLLKLSTEKVQVKIIHKSVGQISESDVLLASASDAIILGFQVRPSTSARKIAEKEQIDIRLYSIIYDAINEVRDAMEGMLAPEVEEKIVCNIEIREVFDITKVGTVAGCMVLSGKITRNTKIRVIRDGIVIHSGHLGSLKRFKDDVKEVATGFECGLNIDKFNDIKAGDIIEGYEHVEVKAKL